MVIDIDMSTMIDIVPFICVTAGFFIVTLFSAYEAYRAKRTTTGSREYSPSDPTGVPTRGSRVNLRESSNSAGSTPPNRGRSHSGEHSAASLEEGRDGGGRAQQEQQSLVSGTGRNNGTSFAGGGVHGSARNGGGGSKGDETRRRFYYLLTIALATRLILLPIESTLYQHSSKYACLNTPICAMARTVPDLTFASAFTLLVLFYAQLAGSASAGGPRGLSLMLTRRDVFLALNVCMYAVYVILLLLASLHVIPILAFQIILWSVLAVLYGMLLFVLAYFGPLLYLLLRPSLMKRSTAKAGLALRLISMCTLLTIVFLSRAISFARAAITRDGRFTHGLFTAWVFPPPPEPREISLRGEYYDEKLLIRDLLGYTLLELLPSLAILLLMHQRRKAGTSSASQSPAGFGAAPAGTEFRPLLQSPQQQQFHGAGFPAYGANAMGGGGVNVPSSAAAGGGGIRRVTSGSAANAPKRAMHSSAGGGTGASGGNVYHGGYQSTLRTSVSVGGASNVGLE